MHRVGCVVTSPDDVKRLKLKKFLISTSFVNTIHRNGKRHAHAAAGNNYRTTVVEFTLAFQLMTVLGSGRLSATAYAWVGAGVSLTGLI